MCLIKVKKVDEEDEIENYRRTSRTTRRSNRASFERVSAAAVIRPAPTQYPVLPAPQPVPVFTRPPPVIESDPDVQFVHVSPRSSSEDSRHHHHNPRRSHHDDHSDVIYERREVRYEREESPERFHEYRYVNAPERPEPRRRERSRSRQRSRSRSRRRDDYYDDEVHVKSTRKYYD